MKTLREDDRSEDGTGFTAAHNFGFRRGVFKNHPGLTGPPEQAPPHRFTYGRKQTKFQETSFPSLAFFVKLKTMPYVQTASFRYVIRP